MQKYILVFFLLCYTITVFAQKNILQVNMGLVDITDLDLRKSFHLGVSYERLINKNLSIFTTPSLSYGSGGGWGFPDNGTAWGVKAYGISNAYPGFKYENDEYYANRRNTSFKIAKCFYANIDLGLGIQLIHYKKHQLNLRVGLSAAYVDESGISEETAGIYEPLFFKEPIKFVIPYYSSYYIFGENLSFPYRYFLKENAFIGITPMINNYLPLGGGYIYGIVLNGGLKF